MKLERWGWYSIGINILLGGINLVVAVASGSLAVAAEMVHNGVDLFAAVAVLLGLKLSARKSKQFPYGLYKLENIISVGISILIFFTAFEIAKRAILAPPTSVKTSLWMLWAIVFSAVLPLAFSRVEMAAGRSSRSPVLIADAQEYRVHFFTSAMVIVVLAGHRYGISLDQIASIAIAFVIGKMGWNLLSDGMRVLLDASLDEPSLAKIREIILAEPKVSELKWVTGRNAGRFRFVEAEILLRTHDLDRSKVITDNIEKKIRQAVPQVDRILIYPESSRPTHLRYAMPLADEEGALSEHFGEAPFFAVVTIRTADGEVEQQRILENPHTQVVKAKGIKVAEWLVGHKIDGILLRENLHGKGPSYVFREAGIEMQMTDTTTLGDCITGIKSQLISI